MIRNYLKIASRNLLRYRFISFINLFSLTVGLTCCLLITTYILNELSYDKYNKNADNIYRVTRSFNNSEGVVSLNLATVAPPLPKSLKFVPSVFTTPSCTLYMSKRILEPFGAHRKKNDVPGSLWITRRLVPS